MSEGQVIQSNISQVVLPNLARYDDLKYTVTPLLSDLVFWYVTLCSKQVVPHVSKNHRAFIFCVKQVTLEVKSFGFFEMKETTGPVTQHHIPENFNL